MLNTIFIVWQQTSEQRRQTEMENPSDWVSNQEGKKREDEDEKLSISCLLANKYFEKDTLGSI